MRVLEKKETSKNKNFNRKHFLREWTIKHISLVSRSTWASKKLFITKVFQIKSSFSSIRIVCNGPACNQAKALLAISWAHLVCVCRVLAHLHSLNTTVQCLSHTGSVSSWRCEGKQGWPGFVLSGLDAPSVLPKSIYLFPEILVPAYDTLMLVQAISTIFPSTQLWKNSPSQVTLLGNDSSKDCYSCELLTAREGWEGFQPWSTKIVNAKHLKLGIWALHCCSQVKGPDLPKSEYIWEKESWSTAGAAGLPGDLISVFLTYRTCRHRLCVFTQICRKPGLLGSVTAASPAWLVPETLSQDTLQPWRAKPAQLLGTVSLMSQHRAGRTPEVTRSAMFGSGHSAGSPGGTRAGLTSSAAGDIEYHLPQKSWNTNLKSHSTTSQLPLQISHSTGGSSTHWAGPVPVAEGL